MDAWEYPPMELLDRSTCFRAFPGHDAGFDGRVFVGVTSTGIHCRPACPAIVARRPGRRGTPIDEAREVRTHG